MSPSLVANMNYTLGTASISQTQSFTSSPACPAAAVKTVTVWSSTYLSPSYAAPTATLTIPYLADDSTT
jgi:hypothetical protein